MSGSVHCCLFLGGQVLFAIGSMVTDLRRMLLRIFCLLAHDGFSRGWDGARRRFQRVPYLLFLSFFLSCHVQSFLCAQYVLHLRIQLLNHPEALFSTFATGICAFLAVLKFGGVAFAFLRACVADDRARMAEKRSVFTAHAHQCRVCRADNGAFTRECDTS